MQAKEGTPQRRQFGSHVALRLVAYPHQQTFYADVFIQRFPMQACAVA